MRFFSNSDHYAHILITLNMQIRDYIHDTSSSLELTSCEVLDDVLGLVVSSPVRWCSLNTANCSCKNDIRS